MFVHYIPLKRRMHEMTLLSDSKCVGILRDNLYIECEWYYTSSDSAYIILSMI